jgi:beta-N-acetylhexosaminidase
MSLSSTALGVLVAGFSGTALPGEIERLAARGLAGTIVFKRNFGAERPLETAATLLARIAALGDFPLLSCIDEEGGRVRRLGAPVPQLPRARVLGAIDDPALTERAAFALGHALDALGVNVDFAPILDVDTNPENPIIGDRAFGSTPEQVVRHALPFAAGLRRAGILSCGKHFPGHGDTDLDSHLALPRVPHGRERLDAVELPPFRAARGAMPLVMTAHVVFSAIEPALPATLSRKVITDLLRGELGYDGVIVSDDLEMKAVADHFGVAASATAAIEAGCDVLLVCEHLERLHEAHEALVKRAEKDAGFRARLEEAHGRIAALRRSLPRRTPAPLPELVHALETGPGPAVLAEIARRAG